MGLAVLQGVVPSAWPFIESILPDMVPLDVPANNRLMAAEKFATIANLMGYIPYPREQIRDAWLKLMEGIDHNYNGTGSEDTHRRKRKYRQYALDAAEEILSTSVRSIAENVKRIPRKEASARDGMLAVELIAESSHGGGTQGGNTYERYYLLRLL